jgi:hypothetical protein
MLTHFKPLRRKIGLITLGLACVFTVAWARSRFVSDDLEVGSGGYYLLFRSEDEEFSSAWRGASQNRRPVMIWHSERTATKNSRFEHYPLPLRYPFIAVPLTLLSVWLLISKPGAGIQVSAPTQIRDRTDEIGGTPGEAFRVWESEEHC